MIPLHDQTVHILLVEDDDVDAELIERAFEKLKLVNEITIVEDGLQAFQALRGEDGYKRVHRPYLILLDINLPRMNGLEFLHKLRQDDELKRSIVFVLTTSNNEADKKAAYTDHVSGYILKGAVGESILDLPLMIKNYWRIVEFPRDK